MRKAAGGVVAVAARQRPVPACDTRDRAIAVPLDLELPARSARDLLRRGRQHRRVHAPAARTALSLIVARPQDQPVLLVAAQPGRNARPGSLPPPPVPADGQTTVPLLVEQLVGPVVPDLDRPRAVLALRDLAFERRVVERVILDVHRKVLLTRLERNALRHGPAREHAVAFQPEVVVQPP